MKTRSFFNRLVRVRCRSIADRGMRKAWTAVCGTALVMTLTLSIVNAQDDTTSQRQPSSGTDSMATGNTQQTSGDSATGVSGAPPEEAAAPAEDMSAPEETSAPVLETAVPATARLRNIDLVNITIKNKKMRVSGWGEYVVGGHCLCCDNMKSIDCVSVQTRNRTDKLKIRQVIDGRIVRDTSDEKTFFGNVFERENPTRPVAVLMTDISWKKMQDVYKVIVYTVADSLKTKNVSFNCQLGYYDQFDRLRWVNKVDNSGHDEQIVFDLEKPMLTKNLLLQIRDGRNKLTEVAIFGMKAGTE